MDDAFIVEKVVRGDREAFRLIVLRHQRPLFRFLTFLAVDAAAVEDIAQQTFLQAYRALGSFDPARAKFATWLFTIAKRLASHEQRRAHHHHEALSQAPALEADARAEDGSAGPSPSDLAIAAERARRLHAALAELPAGVRSTFVLSQVRELSLNEVAEIEGCALGTVKSRIHRARQMLRLALASKET